MTSHCFVPLQYTKGTYLVEGVQDSLVQICSLLWTSGSQIWNIRLSGVRASEFQSRSQPASLALLLINISNNLWSTS